MPDPPARPPRGPEAQRDTVFRQKLGDQYIADAFRLARQADPQALLLYNDYGGEGLSATSDRIYSLVQGLLAQGVPIDGVGLQMHVTATSRPSDANIAANMRRLASLGLSVNISEMDVRIRDVPGTLQARLDVQKSVYHSIVRVCVAEPRCDSVTFWGFTDAHSWIERLGPKSIGAHFRVTCARSSFESKVTRTFFLSWMARINRSLYMASPYW